MKPFEEDVSSITLYKCLSPKSFPVANVIAFWKLKENLIVFCPFNKNEDPQAAVSIFLQNKENIEAIKITNWPNVVASLELGNDQSIPFEFEQDIDFVYAIPKELKEDEAIAKIIPPEKQEPNPSPIDISHKKFEQIATSSSGKLKEYNESYNINYKLFVKEVVFNVSNYKEVTKSVVSQLHVLY